MLGQVAEASYVYIVAHLLEHAVVAFGAYLVEDDACDADVGAEARKALQEGCHAVGCRACIDDEHHWQCEHAGYLGRRAPVAVVAVVEPHHGLDYRHVGRGGIAAEELPYVLGCGHERVEVDAGSAAHCLVELGVDVVGAALEGLHAQALLAEECHEAPGNGGLARAAGGCSYHELGRHFSFSRKEERGRRSEDSFLFGVRGYEV